jgi:Complex I intermediate-associated protein 30 (CIA30)
LGRGLIVRAVFEPRINCEVGGPQGVVRDWGPLDDVVMGGVSESGFEIRAGAGEAGGPAGVFSGAVSTSNSGGFASVSPS